MLKAIIEKVRLFIHFLRTHNIIPQYHIQTFTYYIPAPPPRKTGYREKEFDKLFTELLNDGYKIISINTQSHSGPEGAGLWVLCTLKIPINKADSLNSELNKGVQQGPNSPFAEKAKVTKVQGNEGNFDQMTVEHEITFYKDDGPLRIKE